MKKILIALFSLAAISVKAQEAGLVLFIPEVRLDNGSKDMFTNNNGTATKSASQFALAAVYAF